MFFVLLLFCVSPFAIADIAWTGDAQFKTIYYPEPLTTNPTNQMHQMNQADLKFSYEKILVEDYKFTTVIKFIDYSLDPFTTSPQEKLFFDLPEFNFKMRTSSNLIKIGTDIYSWGITDGLNQFDLVNTRSYIDPIHPIKLGSLSASFNYTDDWLDFDFVFTPKARSPILPWTASRWLPREIYYPAGQVIELRLPSTFSYNYESLPSLSDALSNNTAVRMQFHLAYLDLALYGYDGIAPIPIITPVVTGTILAFAPKTIVQVDSDVTLRTQDYRQKTMGISLNKTISDFQLKGAAAWTQPDLEATPYKHWSQESVFALEKNWTITEGVSLTGILQHSISRRPETVGNDFASLTRFFDNNWMMGGHLLWHDLETITFFYANDLDTNSVLLDLNWETRATETLKFGLYLTYLYGPLNSAFGSFTKNKSISFYGNLVF